MVTALLKVRERLCYEAFREILRAVRQFDARELLVLASQEVVDLLLDEESDSLARVTTIRRDSDPFTGRSTLYAEHFDVVLL